ncbi:MAG: Ltp family lipoprotein [Clostridia bacterium]|nr:Ltp family lipoprotein [Clostridia bacterium]
MSACSGAKKEPASESQPTETEHVEPADGYAELGGLWEVGAIKYNNKIIDVRDVPALADLYDTTYLLFNEDGTFLYINLFFTSGTYTRLNSGDFLLKTDRVYRLKVENGTVVEEESTSGEKSSYLTALVKNDPNSLQFSGYDAITGKAKAGEDPLYFVKSDQESVFINNQKFNVADLASGNSRVTEQTTRFEEYTPTSTVPSKNETTGERNAVQKAKDYLDYTAFSYSGLIEQLKYEGFTESEARYGADYCGANWFEQAARKAQAYLDYTSFSRQGLIEQLEYEGFTSEQAEYGVNQVY